VPLLEQLGREGAPSMTSWVIMIGPRAMPAEITAKLNAAINEAINEPDRARAHAEGRHREPIRQPRRWGTGEYLKQEVERLSRASRASSAIG